MLRGFGGKSFEIFDAYGARRGERKMLLIIAKQWTKSCTLNKREIQQCIVEQQNTCRDKNNKNSLCTFTLQTPVE